jgi:ubiquinone/menaquinone biosynthesis C-methylase UbiE
MEQNIELKDLVKEKYSEIVKDDDCGCSCGSGTVRNKLETNFSLADDYVNLDGYTPDADYSLGCGVPTKHAEIKPGDTVLDLGSGAGNDVFIVQKIVGEFGSVIGLDFTQEMIDKANQNKQKLGLDNVSFKLGDIEDIPLEQDHIDVLISNCVLNLVPDKQKAFQEMYRVLKPGAHFCVSDIVSEGAIPEELKKSAELYAGCVAGAIPKEEYLAFVKQAGFENLQIRKERSIDIPEETAKQYLSESEWTAWNTEGLGLFSITLYAEKPLKD